MLRINQLLLFLFLLNSITSNAQEFYCDLDSIKYTYIDCYGEETGFIDVTLLIDESLHPRSYWWTGPNGFTASQTLTLSNLAAGDYVLTIMANFVPGDTSSAISCSNLEGDTMGGAPTDTITIKETSKLTAFFELFNMCSENDSVDIITTLRGGTHPYTTLWSTGDTARNISNLPPNTLIPPDTGYFLQITDKNNCVDTVFKTIEPVLAMIPGMWVTHAGCKDDEKSGSAGIFIENGSSPFKFQWIISNDTITEYHNSSSEINQLVPGEYLVLVKDTMECTLKDSIIVKTNPNTCLTIYKAFSPNDDFVNEFWKISGLEHYQEALVLVYDRNGRQVYRRRNYANAELNGDAFGGKDQEGRILPSGTYYYVIDLGNGDPVFKGTVAIVR